MLIQAIAVFSVVVAAQIILVAKVADVLSRFETSHRNHRAG